MNACCSDTMPVFDFMNNVFNGCNLCIIPTKVNTDNDRPTVHPTTVSENSLLQKKYTSFLGNSVVLVRNDTIPYEMLF